MQLYRAKQAGGIVETNGKCKLLDCGWRKMMRGSKGEKGAIMEIQFHASIGTINMQRLGSLNHLILDHTIGDFWPGTGGSAIVVGPDVLERTLNIDAIEPWEPRSSVLDHDLQLRD
jgi:hypothetical protein